MRIFGSKRLFAIIILLSVFVVSGAAAGLNILSAGEVIADSPVSLSLCYPCHFNLDKSKPDNLIFSHALHFNAGASCDTCHISFPHAKGKIQTVPVEICFRCHNLKDREQKPITEKDCYTCHFVGFSKADTERIIKLWKNYVPPVIEIEKKQIEQEYLATEGDVKLGKCLWCHDDLEANKPAGLIFSHTPHFEKGVRCAACHQEYPHMKDELKRVPMLVCSACHSLRHTWQGQVASDACELCHPKSFNLLPASHTYTFRQKQHGEEAIKALNTCYTCHAVDFCIKCHNGKVPQNQKKIVPKTHEDLTTWKKEHGKPPTVVADCEPCHYTSFCDNCHKARVPHEVTFIYKHEETGKNLGLYCDRCHKEQEFCSNCHHQNLWDNKLTFSPCDRCHEDLKKPMLQVQGKGLMVHRAHFEMTKTENYQCAECHEREYPTGQGCFSFELCKECHGKTRLGKLVAKWNVDNGELCGRCHPDSSGPAGNIRGK